MDVAAIVDGLMLKINKIPTGCSRSCMCHLWGSGSAVTTGPPELAG